MKRGDKHPLEWAVFAVSLVLVIGTLGYLVYDAVRGSLSAPDPSAPPEIAVRLGKAQRSGAVYAVPVEVHNRGEERAEGVHVEVVLEIPGRQPERAEFEVAFAPRQSVRHGWVTFTQDPAAGRLMGRALGYEKP
jgi:uncharacterized protein (TIGR02588 family)